MSFRPLALLIVGVAVLGAATPSPPGILEIAARSTALQLGIGSAHDTVNTTSRVAQAFYDQGLAYLHSYVWLEAARSFNQALRADPNLAIAHAELSIAYTELNAPSDARAQIELARSVKTSDHDRRHIELRVKQMAAEASSGRGDGSPFQELGDYRLALDEALKRFPADEELWLSRGLAESPDPAERGQGSVAGSIPYFKKAVGLRPDHFAGHHFLTHAYENTTRVNEALAEASTYAKMAPRVPHALHMLGHDLRRAGRADEAIARFLAADTLEREYLAAERIPPEYDWHYQHNLDLLATSYQYVGQMARAEKLLRQSFGLASSMVEQELNKREWPVFLLSRGRPQEALEAAQTMAAHKSPVVAAAGHVMAGEARLALHDDQGAADEANVALRLMRNTEGAGLVAASLRQLQGEFMLRTGDREKGRAALQDVARRVRAAPGPDGWVQAVFALESVARAARDAGDWELADWMARQMMEHDPNYGGSHVAVALVARHKGASDVARDEFALAAKCWKNADPGLPELQTVNRSGK